MFPRVLNPSNSNSFFLFGARGTGKSTFLKERIKSSEVLWIDLLHAKQEDLYRLHPEELVNQVQAQEKTLEWVIIDEVQKLPRLLDTVHSLIESTGVKFILTGSSARKLKHGGANLLAGRAFVYSMHPLTHVELGENFDLNKTLTWGSLPKIFSFQKDTDRIEYLE